jgi:epoxide hydrolase-like protein
MFEAKRWTIAVGDAAVDDLRTRLRHTRWPDEINDDSWGWGVDATYLRGLVDAWIAFDWHGRVREPNGMAHHLADIDGHQVHFIHLPAREAGVAGVPLLLSHGWPGSFVEMLEAPDLLGADVAAFFAVL